MAEREDARALAELPIVALRRIVDRLDHPIALIDREGAVRYANRALAHRLGRPAEDLVGEPAETALAELGPELERRRRELIAGGAGQARGLDDGRFTTDAYELIARGDGDGRVIDVLCVLPTGRTGTEAGDAGRSVEPPAPSGTEALRERLARCESDLQAFSYIASHDLQEPLRTIATSAAIIQRRSGAALDARSKEFLAYAMDAAQRMADLIMALLQFSRVGTDSQTPAAVDLGAMWAAAVAKHAAEIAKLGARVTADPLPMVSGHREFLQLACSQLIANSLKFRGPEMPTIHASAHPHADGWEIRVRDNGIGIEPQFHERVLGIFKRLHTRSVYPGSGAGLAIVRRIVDRHGGRIWIASTGVGGTTIHFTLPAAAT
jgi:signal transduction histidine kinase